MVYEATLFLVYTFLSFETLSLATLLLVGTLLVEEFNRSRLEFRTGSSFLLRSCMHEREEWRNLLLGELPQETIRCRLHSSSRFQGRIL